MRLVRCDKGHIYDADKLGNCPECPGVIKKIDREDEKTDNDNCKTILTEQEEDRLLL